jgi:hypothetical protein
MEPGEVQSTGSGGAARFDPGARHAGEAEMIDNIDKLRCIEREINMRKAVYPKWVAAKRLSQEKADREISVMEAIKEDYLKGVMHK